MSAQPTRRHPVRTHVATDWNGVGKKSATLYKHARLGQHHITVSPSNTSVGGAVAIRMRPVGMQEYIYPRDGFESIDLAENTGSVTVVVDGFYDQIEVFFDQDLVGGTVDVQVVSTGNSLLASLPGIEGMTVNMPTVVLADNWNGIGARSVTAFNHVDSSSHHIAISTSSTPAAGSVIVYGRPVGGSKFVNLSGIVNLSETGSYSAIVLGFFDAFMIKEDAAVDEGITICARVTSADESLQPIPIRADSAVPEVSSSGTSMAPYKLASGEVFTIENGDQALFSMPIDMDGSSIIEAFGALVEQASGGSSETISTTGGIAPYTIENGETFTVADESQVLYSQLIEINGSGQLNAYGLLVEVQ